MAKLPRLQVSPGAAPNALWSRGPLRVAANRRTLEHADGTPFFWMGDTWWMGLCRRFRWPEDFQTLTADRVAKGFSLVQIVAGLYPDMPGFDPRGANEAGFPWEAGLRPPQPGLFRPGRSAHRPGWRRPGWCRASWAVGATTCPSWAWQKSNSTGAT